MKKAPTGVEASKWFFESERLELSTHAALLQVSGDSYRCGVGFTLTTAIPNAQGDVEPIPKVLGVRVNGLERRQLDFTVHDRLPKGATKLREHLFRCQRRVNRNYPNVSH
ncbi:hypothetical protein [Gryllotalpicola koreensis]|uniref:hypothetical protein n=1 Tax=Gryllotalpicola koreensis TaxID=993086 RepID=UPI0031DCE3AA